MKLFFNRKSRGFSLIEVVIAIVILFSVATVICMLYPVSFKGIAMAKDKTVAMALAQQKIEECLTNPRGNYTSGDFSPEHPDYKYDITKTPVSGIKKLKELKVEVYKIINGKKVVGAAMAQLVPAGGGERIYRVVKDSVRIDADAGHDLVLSKQFNAPEEGICIIDFKGCFNPPSPYFYVPGASSGSWMKHAFYITVDGRQDLRSSVWISAIGSNCISTNTAVKVSAGTHTVNVMGFMLVGGVGTVPVAYPTMVIQYIPLSMVEDYDIPSI
ncbi:MAG: type II secretion system protein [Armatimonadota bacterium]